MADPRGNLALTYLAITAIYRPVWVVWENVPGVLSSDSGRDFAAFLSGMGQLGYGWAYRVLDAQYAGVPQRRRRVFVVGCARGWASAAAVLFELESLRGDPAPSFQAGKGIAGAVTSSLGHRGHGSDRGDGAHLVAGALQHGGEAAGSATQQDAESGMLVAAPLTAGASRRSNPAGRRREDDTNLVPIAIQERAVCENAEAGPDGAGFRADGVAYTLEARPVPQAIAFHARQDPDIGHLTHPLDTDGFSIAVAVNLRGREGGSMPELGDLASIRASSGGSSRSYVQRTAVRRLTPRECERLQGFPDDYTLIHYNGKAAKDAPRYKALGNSMAVPVMRWLAQRIDFVESVRAEMTACTAMP